ncbi:MAG: hypothetical protein ABUS56_11790 [Acidobacteriota bacterium]
MAATVGGMWLHAVRKRMLSRGLAALLAVLVCGGALNWGHTGGDDPDCNVVPVHHDHAAHRFSGAPTDSSPTADHCYICHSLRLLQTSLVARGARAVFTPQATALRQAKALVAVGAIGIALSSRAPPAASL